MAFKGHIVTEETRKKISETFRKNYKKENHPFYKKHHKKKSKIKNSLSHLNKQKGEKNPSWKGDNVGYRGLHKWLIENKPKTLFCEECYEKKKLQMANITGIYNRDFSNYKWLCIRCHKEFDFPDGMMGKNLNKKLEVLPLTQK